MPHAIALVPKSNPVAKAAVNRLSAGDKLNSARNIAVSGLPGMPATFITRSHRQPEKTSFTSPDRGRIFATLPGWPSAAGKAMDRVLECPPNTSPIAASAAAQPKVMWPPALDVINPGSINGLVSRMRPDPSSNAAGKPRLAIASRAPRARTMPSLVAISPARAKCGRSSASLDTLSRS